MSPWRIVRKIRRFSFPHNPMADYIWAGMKVGTNLFMMEGCWFDPPHCQHIAIGDSVTLSNGVWVYAHDASTKRWLGYTRIGKVIIGNRVFVGAKAILLPGVTIGDDVIIGAGSVVSRDIPAGHVAAGNPAKVRCTLEAYLSRKRAEMVSHPCFNESYTVRRKVTLAMKAEMNEKMTDRIGYIV